MLYVFCYFMVLYQNEYYVDITPNQQIDIFVSEQSQPTILLNEGHKLKGLSPNGILNSYLHIE